MAALRTLMLLVAVAAVSACAVNPPAPSPVAAGFGRFEDADLSFDYPAEWQAGTFDVVSSFSTALVYLSTQPLADPCTRAPDMIACDHAPVAGLGPNGILVEWSRQSFPGWTFDPTIGRPATIDGRRATTQELTTLTAGCGGIGGEREVVVTIDDPLPDENWMEMRACIRGPDVEGQFRELEAMLDALSFQR